MTVYSYADDIRGMGVIAFRLEQDARDLAAAEEHVVRPFDRSAVTRRVPERLRERERRDERELLRRRSGGRSQDDGGEQRRAGGVLPAASPTSAAGGLVLADGDRALRQPAAAQNVLRGRAALAPQVRASEPPTPGKPRILASLAAWAFSCRRKPPLITSIAARPCSQCLPTSSLSRASAWSSR